jgi:hypothetical protein
MAAILLLIVGAALANVDVQYGRFALRVGWDADRSAGVPAVPSASVATSAPAVSDARAAERAWRADLDGLARELRAELRAASAADPGEAATARADRDALVGQVRALIAESERRQQRELALRLTQVMHDLERQRRADLVRIEQNLGQLEGFTGAEAARQRELLNYLVRVSQQR